MNDPVFPQAALGFRAWRIRGNALHPLFQGSAWRPGDNLAYCNADMDDAHVAPGADCQCGFNAYHSLHDALVEAGRSGRLIAVGAIAGKGHLQVHEHGFRCESAQIMAICLIGVGPGKKKISAALAERYKVPLCATPDELQSLVDQGQATPVPGNLRPQASPAATDAVTGAAAPGPAISLAVESRWHAVLTWVASIMLLCSGLGVLAALIALLMTGNTLALVSMILLGTCLATFLALCALDPERQRNS